MNSLPRSIIVLAILVALVSAAYSFYYQDRPRIDAEGYDKIGWNLARGLGYIEDEANVLSPEKDWAINRVGPGYQFFLAGVYSLFGHNIWAVWILHALLRGISVILVFLLARLLFPSLPKLGVVSALLFGFSPDLIVINGLLLTETLFLFLLVAAVYAALKLFSAEEGVPHAMALLTGLLFAAAILTRPTALLLLFVVVALLAWRREWTKSFLVMLLPLLFIGSWSVFASSRYDMFILTTGVGGYDLWVGNSIDAKGGFEKNEEKLEARYSMSVAELDAFSKKKYFEFLASHPFRFLELQWRKTALYFSLIRPGGYWVHLIAHPWQRFFTLLSSFFWTAALFVFGVAGGWLMFKWRKDIVSRVFLVFALLQPIAVIPVIVETRYRYPLFPFLAIFAAWLFVTRSYNKRILAIVGVLFIIFAGYDGIYNLEEILAKISDIIPF